MPAPRLPLSLERVGCLYIRASFYYHIFQGECCKPLLHDPHPHVPGTRRTAARAQPGPREQVESRAALRLRRRPPAMPPPARGLPLPVRAAASGLGLLPRRSPRTCQRRGGAGSRQPRPCGGGSAGSWRGGRVGGRERCLGWRGRAAEQPAAAGPAGLGMEREEGRGHL